MLCTRFYIFLSFKIEIWGLPSIICQSLSSLGRQFLHFPRFLMLPVENPHPLLIYSPTSCKRLIGVGKVIPKSIVFFYSLPKFVLFLGLLGNKIQYLNFWSSLISMLAMLQAEALEMIACPLRIYSAHDSFYHLQVWVSIYLPLYPPIYLE